MNMPGSTNIERTPGGAVIPAGCGCGAGAPGAPVYVMGALGFDFGSYAMQDAIASANGSLAVATAADLAGYLMSTPADAASVIWTLSVDSVPVYALRPAGVNVEVAYQLLRSFLVDPNIDMLSVPGRIAGSATLLNGQVVPLVCPDLAGIRALSSMAIAAPPPALGVRLLPAPAAVNLTSEGTVDWLRWGLGGLSTNGSGITSEQKMTAGSLRVPHPRLATAAQVAIGGGQIAMGAVSTVGLQTGATTTFSWTDGAVTRTYVPPPGLGSGLIITPSPGELTLTAPADATPRLLRLYVRTGAGGPPTLTATLGGQTRTDRGLTWSNGAFADGCYEIAYCGGSAGDTLAVKWEPSGAAYVGIEAATLQIHAAARSSALRAFTDRLYFELRNLGLSSRERAINHAAAYAATKRLPQLGDATILHAMFGQPPGMQLEGIEAERNERCRPASDCWDVQLRFFNPNSAGEQSRSVFRVTVDVSAVKPVVTDVKRLNEP